MKRNKEIKNKETERKSLEMAENVEKIRDIFREAKVSPYKELMKDRKSL